MSKQLNKQAKISRKTAASLYLATAITSMLWLAEGGLSSEAAQLNRLHSNDIKTGNIVEASALNNEFNQLVNESNSQDTRINNLESQDVSLEGVKTFTSNLKINGIDERTGSAGVTIDGVVLKDAKVKASSVSPGFGEGELGYDDTANVLKYADNVGTKTLATTTDLNNVSAPRYYFAGSAPVYASASTFTLDTVSAKSSVSSRLMETTSQKTLNLATTGLNGIAQSADLTGTVTVTSGGNTVSGTGTTLNTDFQVGDVICVNDTAECRRITALGGASSVTVASNWGVTDSSSGFKRGGKAASTFYNLYMMDDGTTPGFILSTRNVAAGDTLVDLPSGYSHYRQLPFAARNNASGNLIPFYVSEGWPYRPLILYRQDFARYNQAANNTEILTGGTSTSFATISAGGFIPPIARQGRFYLSQSTTGTYVNLRMTGSGLSVGMQNVFSSSNDSAIVTVETDSSQQVDYQVSLGDVDISVLGFVVTEVK